jgi:hypothetical protein
MEKSHDSGVATRALPRVSNVRTVAKTVNLITRSLPSGEQTLQFACLYRELRADSVGLHLGTEVVGFG